MAAFLYWRRIQFAKGTSRHSSTVCLAGSEGALLHHANPTDLLDPCGTSDALIVPKHSGIKPLSAQSRTRLCVFVLKTSAGFAPATFGLSNRRSTIELGNLPRRARPVVSSSFGRRYATRLRCFLCQVARNSRTSEATPSQVSRLSPTLSRHRWVLRLSSYLQSSNRRVALVPQLSLFGVSAVLGATVSGSLHRWPRLPMHSSFQVSSPRCWRDKPLGMGLHDWPLAWRGRAGRSALAGLRRFI